MGSAKISVPATTQRVTTPVADETCCFVFLSGANWLKWFRMGLPASAYEAARRELSIGAKKSGEEDAKGGEKEHAESTPSRDNGQKNSPRPRLHRP